jgi:hypothetical protein
VDTHSEEPPRLVDAGDLGIFSGMEEFNGSGSTVDAKELVLGRPFNFTGLTGA